MKKLSNYLMMALLATGMIACSDSDSSEDDSNLSNNTELYMSFNLSIPETRSETDGTTGGTGQELIGTDAENAIKDIQVVLVDGSGVPFAYSTRNTLSSGSSGYTATFQSRDVLKKAGTQCFIYIACNGVYPTGTAATTLKDGTYKIDAFPTPGNNIWGDNHFLMTNADKAPSKDLPAATELATHNTPTNPFALGTINVERSAVRFDYQAAKDDNLYPLAEGINVKLLSTAVVNASKSFYYLRRVSADGKAEGAVLGEKEVDATPYVVDTDAKDKYDGRNKVSDFTAGMANNFYNYANNAHSYGEFSDLPTDKTAYTKIHYTTENTLPKDVIPQEGNTTAVVFKAELVIAGTGHDALQTAMNNKHRLYVFNNKIYGDWAALKKYVVTDRGTNKDVEGFAELEFAYQKAAATFTGPKTEPELADAAASNFKVFTATPDGHYYVYYYYWNKHNDKYIASNTIAERHMEYATVRNNVYQLKVNNIKKFGHPEDPAGDTDVIAPDNPIDPNEVYFSVTVNVLKWTLRQNDIEF